MKKILVIDDDDDFREMLKALLEQEKFQVITSADGIEGFVRAKDDKPHLIIMDILMPNLDGQSLVQDILGLFRGSMLEDIIQGTHPFFDLYIIDFGCLTAKLIGAHMFPFLCGFRYIGSLFYYALGVPARGFCGKRSAP